MSIHGVLGESTNYPKTYQPDTLYAIPRALGRDIIASKSKSVEVALNVGVDWWHAFELSWLNHQGISQVAVARFTIPASSPNIVESKSLKLYLNSLNFTEFDSWATVQDTIAKDLSACVGVQVGVELFELDDLNTEHNSDNKRKSGFLIAHPQGECIDTALQASSDKVELVAHPDARLLVDHNNSSYIEPDTQQFVDQVIGQEHASEISYQLYSNLLRSNCPVTNQPDWGSLVIEMTTNIPVNKANLLKYILSYRQHNGFHEQCVEQVFSDITQYFNPSKLMVRACYTRRGGIDINPCRVSDISLIPEPCRLVRQ